MWRGCIRVGYDVRDVDDAFIQVWRGFPGYLFVLEGSPCGIALRGSLPYQLRPLLASVNLVPGFDHLLLSQKDLAWRLRQHTRARLVLGEPV